MFLVTNIFFSEDLPVYITTFENVQGSGEVKSINKKIVMDGSAIIEEILSDDETPRSLVIPLIEEDNDVNNEGNYKVIPITNMHKT